jgi:hypothetical protein
LSTSDKPARKDQPLPLSHQLAQIAGEDGPDRLTFTDLAEHLEARAWGGLLFLFAAINMLPLPPGTSAFFAIPLLIVSAQMVFGRDTPWFPARLDRRGVAKQHLRRLIGTMGWLESRVERIFKPRLPQLTGRTAARVIGAVCFLLALVAGIPIPLFHIAPAGAIVLFGLALIYRDGALTIVAAIASVLSIAIDALIVGSGVAALSYLTSWLHR